MSSPSASSPCSRPPARSFPLPMARYDALLATTTVGHRRLYLARPGDRAGGAGGPVPPVGLVLELFKVSAVRGRTRNTPGPRSPACRSTPASCTPPWGATSARPSAGSTCASTASRGSRRRPGHRRLRQLLHPPLAARPALGERRVRRGSLALPGGLHRGPVRYAMPLSLSFLLTGSFLWLAETSQPCSAPGAIPTRRRPGTPCTSASWAPGRCW